MRPAAMSSADLDSDGDLDIVATDILTNDLLWYENQQGAGFVSHTFNVNQAAVFRNVTTGDVDGDGDTDIVGSLQDQPYHETLYWVENLDGRGSFGQPRGIGVGEFSTSNIELADLNGDGALDVVTVGQISDFGVGAWWYENIDGQGGFAEMEFLGTPGYSASRVAVGDIDGIGGLDVLVMDSGLPGEGLATVIGWYPNHGLGTFGPPEVIIEDGPFYYPNVELRDIDGDGDLDLLLSYERGSFWVENVDGRGSFGQRHIIQETRLRVAGMDVTACCLAVEDLDGDNDLDMVVSMSPLDGCCDAQSHVVWYENRDGKGLFGDAQVIGAEFRDFTYLEFFVVSDFDGDEDSDIFAFPREGAVIFRSHVNRAGLPSVGDVNADGTVGFADFLALSTNYGKTDAVRAEGDLDGDGTVGFADFLLLAANFG